MKQKENQAQQHFKRNPDGQEDPNNPFNDPFFKQFFGNPPAGGEFNGNGERRILEKDW